jgi:hypothetical protein
MEGAGEVKEKTHGMRKGVLLTLVVLMALSFAPPGSAEPYARRDRVAEAEWFVPTKNQDRFRWFFVRAVQSDEQYGDGQGPDEALMGKGICIREYTESSYSYHCFERERVTGKADGHFEMDDTAQWATLEIETAGGTYSVEWQEEKPYGGLYGKGDSCEDANGNEGVGQGGGIFRGAIASGRMFGERLKLEDTWYGEMRLYYSASQCSYPQPG